MKVTLLILTISIILIACNNLDNPKEIDYIGYIEKSFYLTGNDSIDELKDSLALLQMKVPQRLDTFYRWNDYSCCSSCGWIKYRFADKKYSQFAESGWYWTTDPDLPDSVYQLSIWHRPTREVRDSITLKPLRKKDTILWYHPAIVSFSKPTNFLLKEYRLINEKPFIVSAFISPYGYLTKSQTLFIIAETNLKSRELYFIGECGANDTIGFIENIYKSFLSIKISEKQ